MTLTRSHRQASLLVPLISVAVLLIALAAAPAAPASARDVIRDCSEDGSLDGHYSQGEIQQALEQLPSDLDEYTDCRSVIRSAQLGSAGRRHTRKRNAGIAGRVDSTSPATPAEEQRIGAAGSHNPVRIGGQAVSPGAAAAPVDASGFGGELPPLLLALLIATACALFLGAVFALRRSPRASGPMGRIGDRIRRGAARFRR